MAAETNEHDDDNGEVIIVESCTARKACECVTVFNCITARLSRLYDGNGHHIDSHVFAYIFRKCTTFARRVLVFGPILVLVCRRRALVLSQYL